MQGASDAAAAGAVRHPPRARHAVRRCIGLDPESQGGAGAGPAGAAVGVPTTAITAVPRRAIRPDELRGPTASMVQVIRNEYVTNVPVQVLGGLGNDRIQISGLLRETDVLIIGSSVPLMPGTLVRFADAPGAHGIEGTSPDPSRSGVEAGITPPGGVQPTTSGRGGAATRRLSPPTQPQPGSVRRDPVSIRTPGIHVQRGAGLLTAPSNCPRVSVPALRVAAPDVRPWIALRVRGGDGAGQSVRREADASPAPAGDVRRPRKGSGRTGRRRRTR